MKPSDRPVSERPSSSAGPWSYLRVSWFSGLHPRRPTSACLSSPSPAFDESDSSAHPRPFEPSSRTPSTVQTRVTNAWPRWQLFTACRLDLHSMEDYDWIYTACKTMIGSSEHARLLIGSSEHARLWLALQSMQDSDWIFRACKTLIGSSACKTLDWIWASSGPV